MTCLNGTSRPEGSPVSWPHSSTPTPPFLVSHPLPLVTPWEKHWTVDTTSSATSLPGGLAPAPLGEWMHMADFNWLTLHTTFLRHLRGMGKVYTRQGLHSVWWPAESSWKLIPPPHS